MASARPRATRWLLAAGQLARARSASAPEAEPRQHLGHAPAPLGPGPMREAEAHVVGDGQVREQRVALEHVAEPPPLGRHVDAGVGVEEHVAVHRDAPGVGPHEPGQALEGERLARARRPEERHDPSLALPRRRRA